MSKLQIQSLSSRHYRIMDFVIAGWKNIDIASKLNITPQNVLDVKKSILFQDELAQRRTILDSQISRQLSTDISDQEYVNAELSKATRLAVDKLVGFIEPDAECSNAIARQAASDLLDRGGFPKLTKTEQTTNAIFVLNQDDLERIEKTILIDVEQEKKIVEKSETKVIDSSFDSSEESI